MARNPLVKREHGALFRAQAKGLDALVQYAGKDNLGNDTFSVPSQSRDLRHLIRMTRAERPEDRKALSCTCESWLAAVERDPATSICTHIAAVRLYLSHGRITVKRLPYSRKPSPRDRDWRSDPEHSLAS